MGSFGFNKLLALFWFQYSINDSFFLVFFFKIFFKGQISLLCKDQISLCRGQISIWCKVQISLLCLLKASLSKVCFVENLIFSLHWESSVHVCCFMCLIEDYIFSVMHLPPPILKVLTIIHNLHIELKYVRFCF